MTRLKQRQFQPSTDGTLSSNSDNLTPSEKAVKTYVDSKASGLVTTEHTHSKLVASDGNPDPAVYCDANGWLQSMYGIWVTNASAGFSVYDGHMFLDGGSEGGAANTGGALLFRGYDGSNARVWAYVRGMKENSTSGNYASYISFASRPNGSATREVARFDSAGRFLTPYQPVFNAYASANATDVTGDNTTYTVRFDAELFDVGSNYDNTTYRFTAPVTGTYLLGTHVMIGGMASNNTAAYLSIVTSARTYTYLCNPYAMAGSQYLTLPLVVVANMTAAHTAYVTVNVQTWGGGAGSKVVDIIAGASNTNFFGYLIG